jgi:Uma2 family endonuclease
VIFTAEADVPALVGGDFLSRDEFLRRWEAMPQLERAELIRRVVYLPSIKSLKQADTENRLWMWLGVYETATPGCQGSQNVPWLMGENDAPQPDTALFVLPEGDCWSPIRGRYASGVPDFVAEVCSSRSSFDLHQKLEVYQEAGVQEYLAVLMHEREVRWHRLARRRLKVVPAPDDGVHRSAAFPGVWLDAAALLAGNLARVLAVLQQGINSPEHDAFVNRLAARRSCKR